MSTKSTSIVQSASSPIDKNDIAKDVTIIRLQVEHYLKDLEVLQKNLDEDFVKEFGVNEPINITSQAKLARLTSKFCHYQSKSLIRRFPRKLEVMFDIWLKLRKNLLGLDSSTQNTLSRIAAKIAFAYFYNGEIIKALVCVMDYCNLAPDDYIVKETALKWLAYLGETEILEEKFKKWAPTFSKEFVQLMEKFISYIKNRETRGEVLFELIKIAEIIKKNAEEKQSFHSYELVSTSSWILSILGNVARSTGLENKKFPDRASHLTTAIAKADMMVKNKVGRLNPFPFNKTHSSNILKYLESKSGCRSEYLVFGCGIAWMFELRNELANVYINSAQAREAQKALIINWGVSLKSCSFIRVLQSVNMMHYYWKIVTIDDAQMYRTLLSETTVNMLSPDPIIVRCNTPLGKHQTEEQPDQTMMITDGINDLSIAGIVSIHSVSNKCQCFTCILYYGSSTMAAEYMFARMIYFNFSQQAMSQFGKTFIRIRERTMTYQLLFYKDDSVRPRPPITLGIVFVICAIRWLSLKYARKEKYDEPTKHLIETAMKISQYIGTREINLMLTIQQFNRQLRLPHNMNLSWMQPIVKMSIESPFGSHENVMMEANQKLENDEMIARVKQELRYDSVRYNHTLNREWRSQMYTYIGRTTSDPWEAGFTWMESTSIGTRSSLQQRIGMSGNVTISNIHEFKACVESMPEDMTIVQISRADDGNVYMIKLHSDREPIIMPIAHETKMSEMMRKFTSLLMEDEKIAKNPGNKTAHEFWETRKIIDARIKKLVYEVQENFLGVAAYFLLPSNKLGPKSAAYATRIKSITKGGIKLGEAKELVYLMTKMNESQWCELVDRYVEMRKIGDEVIKSIKKAFKTCMETVKKESDKIDNKNYYTYLNICPDLSQFCWEHLPIFKNHPFVCRVTSIHAMFCQLDVLNGSGKKEIPVQVDVQKAYYIIDPDNNLDETKERMLKYVQKFQWKGTAGAAPAADDVSVALEENDAFFYIGHGSGSSHISRHTINKSKCNAISVLMGCGSVKIVPQGTGFDGKSVLFDYAVAKCPLIVGCLWTVTDGDIDRYFMRMIDDCFVRNSEGVNTIRHLAEAMATARSHVKLKFLTGASVVMYGFPVVSKPEPKMVTPESKDKVEQKGMDVLENVTNNDIFVEPSCSVTPKIPRTPSRSRKLQMVTPTSKRLLRSSQRNSANK